MFRDEGLQQHYPHAQLVNLSIWQESWPWRFFLFNHLRLDLYLIHQIIRRAFSSRGLVRQSDREVRDDNESYALIAARRCSRLE